MWAHITKGWTQYTRTHTHTFTHTRVSTHVNKTTPVVSVKLLSYFTTNDSG